MPQSEQRGWATSQATLGKGAHFTWLRTPQTSEVKDANRNREVRLQSVLSLTLIAVV